MDTPGKRAFVDGAAARLAVLLLVVPAVAEAASFSRRPYTQNVTASSVVIRWAQPFGNPGATVIYGPRGGATLMQAEAATLTGQHEITLNGLTGGTRYAYTVDLGGGVTAVGEFTTAVAPADPFTFIVYGDNRTNDADHQTVVNAMQQESVDFLINTGDVVPNGFSWEYDDFFNIEAALLSQNVLFPTLGNHEYALGINVGEWQNQFATPSASSGTERYYYFDFGNSRFVVLDFNSTAAAQTTWLRNTLSAARAAGVVHLFAVMHHSPYDSGNHGENTFAQTNWAPIFQQYALDLIVGGHDHDYERGYVQQTGLRYIVTGGGGAPLYNTNSQKPYQIKFESVLHYVKIAVTGPMVSVTALQPDGTVIDNFSFTSAGAPADGGVTPDAGLADAAPDLTAPSPDLAGPQDLRVTFDAPPQPPDLARRADLSGGPGAADLADEAAVSGGGCACSTSGRGGTGGAAVALLLLVGLLARRRLGL